MATKPTEAMLRALCQIDEAGSAVIASQGSITRVLAAGEYIKCMPDTILRLLVGGWLIMYGDGRIRATVQGQEAADRFRGTPAYAREAAA